MARNTTTLNLNATGLFSAKSAWIPANASSIILTTITDVSTLGIFLGLASWLL